MAKLGGSDRGEARGTVVRLSPRRAVPLHFPDPRPVRYTFIGATALLHSFVVATRSVAAFEPMDLAVLNL